MHYFYRVFIINWVNEMKFISQFKSLPVSTKRLLSFGIILALAVALPLFIWAVITQRFLIIKKAASGEPTPTPVATCQPRPACLDSMPRCEIPEPAEGWCPPPTTTPPGGTPPPTVRPFEILFKFEGVNDDGASFAKLGENYAKVVVKFLGSKLNYALGFVTPPIPVDYVGNGIYALHFGVWSADLPEGNDYSITLKGEKHVATKFCLPSGQTTRCTLPGIIALPSDPLSKVNLTFTGIPLQPGDVFPQDGAVTTLGTGSDFARLLVLLAKSPASLTSQDLLTGDLDYNGVINIRDLFLLRQTLQTRYDEN